MEKKSSRGDNNGGLVFPARRNNPLTQVQARVKDLETGFRSWLALQPLYVATTVVTAGASTQGDLIGALMGTITGDVASFLPAPPPGFNPSSSIPSPLKQVQCVA